MSELSSHLDTSGADEQRSAPRPRSAWARWGPGIARIGRMVYLLCAAMFAGSVVLQVFFAGAGVLVSPSYWGMHRLFGAIVVPLSLALVPIGIVAWLPRRMQVLNVLTVVLFVLQFVFLWVLAQAFGTPALRALHAVNALALFSITLHLTKRTWYLLRPIGTVGTPV